MKKVKQLKDQRFRLYTIKIDRIREVKKLGRIKGFKDKMFCVDIRDHIGGGKAFCEPTLKKLFVSIKREL